MRTSIVFWQGIRAILERARLAMLFFNNHRRGMAAENATEMQGLLRERGLPA